jgi:xanthine dehydrogenase iron-sulfur cluster and FAD-binding subunit A
LSGTFNIGYAFVALLLTTVDGKHVITVEGIGNVNNPHPAQEVLPD